ncbi:MAG: aldose epimerase family protein [Tissierellia bacterium]|nr:aldose epimerase family protein [Tissierellia bacterium]
MIEKFKLKNSFLSVEVTNFGARIISLVVKKLNRNVILAYKKLEDYKADPNYFGASIGPNANRIKNGEFVINDKIYKWDHNNGPNNNHSGKYGLDKEIWDLSEKTDDRIVFSIKKQEPFVYEARATYSLKGNILDIRYEAQAEEPAIFNFTNHAYFNLEGFKGFDDVKKIYGHKLKLYSNEITPCDDFLIPTGEVRQVLSGPYNFDKGKLLGKTLENNLDLFGLNRGYDTNYLMKEAKYQEIAYISVGDLSLKVFSDAPGFQVYTGNFIKINGQDRPHIGMCIEPQNVPNSMNSTVFDQPIYQESDLFERRISYEFNLI